MTDTEMHIPSVIRNPRFSAHSCSSYYHEPFTERKKGSEVHFTSTTAQKNDKFVQIWRVSHSHLLSINWYNRSTSLELGGSESGSICLSLKKLDVSFTVVLWCNGWWMVISCFQGAKRVSQGERIFPSVKKRIVSWCFEVAEMSIWPYTKPISSVITKERIT